MALEMRERCERCAWPLAVDDDTAYICSYECTFCATCANALNGVCRNCGGELERHSIGFPRHTDKPRTAGRNTASSCTDHPLFPPTLDAFDYFGENRQVRGYFNARWHLYT